jgi:hypothetical protein
MTEESEVAAEQPETEDAPEEDNRTMDEIARDEGFSFRDVVSFLRGRDVMDARKAHYICERVKELANEPDDGSEQKSLVQSFSRVMDPRITPAAFLNNDAAHGVAMFKVLKQPEFQDVRSYFERLGQVMETSVEAMSTNHEIHRMMKEGKHLDITNDPKTMTALFCDPDFIDPILWLERMPQVSEQTMDRFSKAIESEAKLIKGKDDAGVEQDAQAAEASVRDLLKASGQSFKP